MYGMNEKDNKEWCDKNIALVKKYIEEKLMFKILATNHYYESCECYFILDMAVVNVFDINNLIEYDINNIGITLFNNAPKIYFKFKFQ